MTQKTEGPFCGGADEPIDPVENAARLSLCRANRARRAAARAALEQQAAKECKEFLNGRRRAL